MNDPPRLVVDRCPDAHPLLTIAIPTFRRPHLLADALGSACAQTRFVDCEIIIIDNEPDPVWTRQVDAVIETFEDHRIRLFRNPRNVGMFGNWNRCLQLARGDHICILNDDDRLDNSFVDEAMPYADGETIVIVAHANFGPRMRKRRMSSVTRLVRRCLAAIQPTTVLPLSVLCFKMPTQGTLGMIIPRQIALDAGGFDPGHHPISDYAFLFRAARRAKIMFVRKVLAHYRLEENESLRLSSLIAFTLRAHSLKLRMIRSLNPPSGAWSAICRVAALTATHHASLYRLDINRKFNGLRILRRAGIYAPRFPRSIAAVALPWLWRVCFRSIPHRTAGR